MSAVQPPSMAREQAAWAQVSEVADLVAAVRWASRAWMYLERVPQTYLDAKQRAAALQFCSFDSTVAVAQWERGRIFDADQELRWERLDDTVHAVYCGHAPPATMASFELDSFSVSEAAYYLWGQLVRPSDRDALDLDPDAAAFIELRMPRVLYYPVANTTRRVRVRVCEHRGSDGSLIYTRWMGLSEESR